MDGKDRCEDNIWMKGFDGQLNMKMFILENTVMERNRVVASPNIFTVIIFNALIRH